MGYRKISHYLNERGIKTTEGNKWKNTTVHSVLKRYRERQERLKLRNKRYKPIRSKMWLEYLNPDYQTTNPTVYYFPIFQTFHTKTLLTTLCLTIAVFLGSVGGVVLMLRTVKCLFTSNWRQNGKKKEREETRQVFEYKG